MKIARHVAADLSQRFGAQISRNRLLADFARAKFSPGACADILADHLLGAPEVADFLDPDSVARGDMAATHRLLYAAPEGWNFGFFACDSGGAGKSRSIRTFRLTNAGAASVARLLRSMLNGEATPEAYAGLPIFQSVDLDLIFDSKAPRRSWPRPGAPGIYRREHASVMVQSASTRVVFDPVCLSPVVPFATTVEPDTDVAAVLITHSHQDHWHIPSTLASAATAETPVVVPNVPKATLLCPNMAEQLAAVGQTCLHPQWGSTLRFGDLDVDVLPFYGEQPAVDACCPDRDVRNWGNCYRINTADFSALLLVDSGADPAGSMVDVVAGSVAARGPVDVVLACMRDFLSPFEVGGLSNYWMTLPFADLERLYALYESGRLPTTTAGLLSGGLAAVCKAAGARTFVPYAQGFAGVGAVVPAGGWGPSPTLSEPEALVELERQLQGVGTSVQSWCPGDALLPHRSGLRHWDCGEPRARSMGERT